jgi:hypothetical protein
MSGSVSIRLHCATSQKTAIFHTADEFSQPEQLFPKPSLNYVDKLERYKYPGTDLIETEVTSSSIVSDYGLDDREIEVRSPTGADFSSSPCVQTGSGAHPAPYPMGTGGSFPEGKARLGRDADHLPPSSAEVKNE